MLKRESQNQGHILDTYAGFFQIYGPVFNRKLEALSKKEIIRVVHALKENTNFDNELSLLNTKSLIRLTKLWFKFPLEEEQIKPLNEKELKLYSDIDEILSNKYTKMIYDQTLNAEEQEMEMLKNLAEKERDVASIANKLFISKSVMILHTLGESLEKEESLKKAQGEAFEEATKK